jgi:hypothetical protein
LPLLAGLAELLQQTQAYLTETAQDFPYLHPLIAPWQQRLHATTLLLEALAVP